ncbi:hypothetical protein [Flavisphingomonas formosensis]|uniref:hypothetical protein n=1 Tax=Flavisphingomonas formosensis TaxID=861534 RepID=UPI0018DF7ACF|nr:hypothetical protein [Sphingomonas formosensis]
MINLRTAAVASAIAVALAGTTPASAGFISSGGWSSSGGTCKKHCGTTSTSSTSGGTTTSSTSGGTTTSSSSGGTPVPEPADFALFAAGIAGLVIGRRSSRRRRTS